MKAQDEDKNKNKNKKNKNKKKKFLPHFQFGLVYPLMYGVKDL